MGLRHDTSGDRQVFSITDHLMQRTTTKVRKHRRKKAESPPESAELDMKRQQMNEWLNEIDRAIDKGPMWYYERCRRVFR